MTSLTLLQLSLIVIGSVTLLLSVFMCIVLVGLMRQERLRHQEGRVGPDQISVQTIQRHLFLIALPSYERIGWPDQPPVPYHQTQTLPYVLNSPRINATRSPIPPISANSGDTTWVGRALRTS